MIRNLLITLCCIMAGGSEVNAETYFWVGGSGNWSDISHWSISSGGNVFHEVIPGADDDVVFDQNSFFNVGEEVTLDVASASFRNMTWTTALNLPVFRNPSSASLIVYGSFELIPQMDYQFTGSVIFRGMGNHIVQTHNHVLGGNAYFDDPTGEWTVLSPLTLTNAVFIRKGAVILQDDVACRYFHVNPTDSTDNCSLIAQGNINIDGNDTTSGGNPFRSFFVQTDLAQVNLSPGINIDLNGTNTSVDLAGATGSISLPNINFTNAAGTQRVLAEDGLTYIFANLRFASNGYVTQSGNLGNLTLTGGKSYRFGSNEDFTINQLLTNGSCTAPIYLFSTSIGSAARFNSPNTVSSSFLNIRDIHVSAGNFQISDAKDLGNAAGWNLNDIGTQDLYWVGGNGSWQDQSHWSLTSGGTGGACIPTPIDNVIFDANSFIGNGQVVELTSELSYCRNMSWIGVVGVPVFRNAGKSINISGSVLLDPGMIMDMRGVVRLDAYNSNHTITSAGHMLGTDVRLEAINGTYTLLDGLNVNGRLLHVYGGLISGGNDMQIIEYQSNYSTARTIDLTNSTVTITGISGRPARWDIGSNNLNFLADNSTINVTTGISLINRGGGTLQFNRVLFNSTGNIYAYNGVNARFRHVSMASTSFVFANNQFDTLAFAPSQTYEFSSGSTQSIGRLESIGTCAEPINIKAQSVGKEAIFFTDLDDSDIRSTMVQDIHVQGAGQMQNVQGIDNGNTDGWIIPNDAGRTLYWIGDGGNWNDIQHWSASSGGPGGECVPTSIDDVIFDVNSFSIPNQEIAGGNIFFKNMTWTGATNVPSVRFTDAAAFGSILLQDDMNIASWSYIRLSGDNPNNILDTKGKAFIHLVMNATGDWTLDSPLNQTGQLFIYNGGLNTNDQDISAERLRIWERDYLNIDLTSSQIDFFGDGISTPVFAQYQSGAAQLDFDPGTSVMNINHPNGYVLVGSEEVSLYDLNFTATTGRGRMEVSTDDPIDYNKVVFNNDGYFLRQHVMDTLVFAPGKTYTLHSGREQVVNQHFQILGSPCAPITLNATSIGVPATITKNNGPVDGDYINMRDQIGNGATFNAGQHSTNVANSNEGWIFEEIDPQNPERGVLGDDQILCDDASIMLNPYPYQNNLTFSWNDGNTQGARELSALGTYWVDIEFAPNCMVRDSIELTPQVYSNTDLGADTILCDGVSLELDAAIGDGTYVWQDQSTGSTFDVQGEGQYFVEVTYLGCPNTDTINVAYDRIPQPDLGPNQLACKDEIVTLTSNVSFDNILWSDGSNGPTLDVSLPDTFWVDVTEGVCTMRDSIEITYFDLENYLGRDTSICEGSILELTIPGEGQIAYEWSDGRTANTIIVDEAGTYGLTLTREDCSLFDDILVEVRPPPSLELINETTICAGDNVVIIPTSNGETYEWSNGDTSKGISLSEEGSYRVTAYLNGCESTAVTTLFLDEPPIVDLGSDTSVCVQIPLYITLNVEGGKYTWNDGSTFFSKTIDASGTYSVSVVSGVCTVEDEIQVEVRDCKEFIVYAPNVFSPNGDGQNDVFRPEFDQSLVVLDYKIVIVNRWGGVVFETSDIENAWDGTINGKALMRGNYVYTMEFTYQDELRMDRKQVSGDVFLAR